MAETLDERQVARGAAVPCVALGEQGARSGSIPCLKFHLIRVSSFVCLSLN